MAGLRIGPWRLERELGRGGMGSVWLAERVEGDFAQQVAIKLIRPGYEKGQLVERFAAERRILAALVHPAIARLYDGGTTGDGRPYFVMEYVEGRTLTELGAELPIARRLELFLDVADAVAYAHRNLVVHRDIKPGNILVGANLEPKLLDFGIAKLIDPERNLAQTINAFAFTAEYASPEQVMGQAITTATDVYGLGAVLYELLTGKKAQPVETQSPAAIYRAACITEPQRPSLAAPANRRELAGDLDAIVMMALRKEPERRYASASELAEDLRRHLAAEPVRARQGTLSYRAGLFARRNKVVAAAGFLIALSLLVGILATSWQARERAKEAQRAERRFAQVRNLATRFLFDFDRAIAKLPGSTEARNLVVATAVESLDGLAADSVDDVGLELELARAYTSLGRIQGSIDSKNLGRREDALASLRKALALSERLVAADPKVEHREILAQTRLELGTVLTSMHRREEALSELRQAVEITRGLIVGGNDWQQRLHTSSLMRLSDLLREGGDYQEARQLLEEVRSNSPQPPVTALARLGLVCRESGDLEAAKSFFEQALVALSKERNPAQDTECWLDSDLARTFYSPDKPSLDRPVEAAELALKSVACGQALVALDEKNVSGHLVTIEALGVAAGIVTSMDRGQALALYDQAEKAIARLESFAPQALDFAAERRKLAAAKAAYTQEAPRRAL